MNKVFFTVGPSQLYPTVPQHVQQALQENIPSISHRSQQFFDLYKETMNSLRKLLDIPDSSHIFFLGSATEAMERIVENTVEKKSCHFANGVFSKRFFTIAQDLGKNAQLIESAIDKSFDLKNLTITQDTELISITQNETSGGTKWPMEDIYKLKERYPNALISLDVVSSAPYVNLDFTKLDMVFFSIQKGFGLPAGLAVLIVNEASLKKAQMLSEKHLSIGSYHNFLSLQEHEQNYQTLETPNVFYIYLLNQVVKDMIKYDVQNIRRDTETKAQMIYDFFDKHTTYKPLIQEKQYRSLTTIVINSKGHTSEMLPKLAEKGFIVASGYGEYKDSQIRIANFPSTTIQQVKDLLSTFNTLYPTS